MVMLPENPGLRRDNHVLAELAVVADVHQIIDLRAAPNAGRLQRAAIDGRVRPDLHVVADFKFSDLRKFFVTPALRIANITKAIAAQHRARMDNHAIAQP